MPKPGSKTQVRAKPRVPAQHGLVATLVPVVAIYLLSLLVRLVFLQTAHDSPFMARRLIDEQDYHTLARHFLSGTWPGDQAIFRPPLYPLFLAALYQLVGDATWTVRLAQSAVGAWAAPLTLLVARRVLGSPRQAVAAGVLVAVCGPLVYYDAQLLAASLDVVLVLVGVLLLLRAAESDLVRDWLLAGAALGIAATNRGTMLLVVPVGAAWLLTVQRRKTWRDGASRVVALVAGALLMVAPLAWHNARHDGRPEVSYAVQAPPPPPSIPTPAATVARMIRGAYSPLGWADGINLYIGNVPELAGVNADTNVVHFDWFNRLSQEPWSHGATMAHEHSAWFKAKTREFVVQHPREWYGWMGRKVFELVNGYEIPRGTSPYAERDYSPLLALLLWSGPLKFPSGLLLPLAIVAAFALWPERPLRLVILVMATQLLFVLGFFVTSRYRLPALPLAIILAVALCTRLVASFRAGQRTPRTMAIMGAVVALIVVSNLGMAGQNLRRTANEEYDVAHVANIEGQGAVALEHVQRALELEPAFGKAHVLRGLILQKAGRSDEALQQAHRALELEPTSAGAHVLLGYVHLTAGRTNEAQAAYEAAVRLDAWDFQANFNLAAMHLRARRLTEAEKWFRAAAAADPHNGESRFYVGFLLSERGRNAEAIGWLEAAQRWGFAHPQLRPLLDRLRRLPAESSLGLHPREVRG